MAVHSRDAVVTVSAAVTTRSRADCSSMDGHTSLSTALVIMFFKYVLMLSFAHKPRQAKVTDIELRNSWCKVCFSYCVNI